MLRLSCVLDSNDSEPFLQSNIDSVLAQQSTPSPQDGHRISEQLLSPTHMTNWCELVAGDLGGGRDLERTRQLGGQ